jgi:hypothetical protein
VLAIGPFRHPERARNYRPKTGKELATAANHQLYLHFAN